MELEVIESSTDPVNPPSDLGVSRLIAFSESATDLASEAKLKQPPDLNALAGTRGKAPRPPGPTYDQNDRAVIMTSDVVNQESPDAMSPLSSTIDSLDEFGCVFDTDAINESEFNVDGRHDEIYPLADSDVDATSTVDLPIGATTIVPGDLLSQLADAVAHRMRSVPGLTACSPEVNGSLPTEILSTHTSDHILSPPCTETTSFSTISECINVSPDTPCTLNNAAQEISAAICTSTTLPTDGGDDDGTFEVHAKRTTLSPRGTDEDSTILSRHDTKSLLFTKVESVPPPKKRGKARTFCGDDSDTVDTDNAELDRAHDISFISQSESQELVQLNAGNAVSDKEVNTSSYEILSQSISDKVPLVKECEKFTKEIETRPSNPPNEVESARLIESNMVDHCLLAAIVETKENGKETRKVGGTFAEKTFEGTISPPLCKAASMPEMTSPRNVDPEEWAAADAERRMAWFLPRWRRAPSEAKQEKCDLTSHNNNSSRRSSLMNRSSCSPSVQSSYDFGVSNKAAVISPPCSVSTKDASPIYAHASAGKAISDAFAELDEEDEMNEKTGKLCEISEDMGESCNMNGDHDVRGSQVAAEYSGADGEYDNIFGNSSQLILRNSDHQHRAGASTSHSVFRLQGHSLTITQLNVLSIPNSIGKIHGHHIVNLNVTGGTLSNFAVLKYFTVLKTLVADYNCVSQLGSFPEMKLLEVLSLAHNNIEESFVAATQAQQRFPILKQLNLIGNPCCPVEGPAAFRYRQSIIRRLPVLQILDGTSVRLDELKSVKEEVKGNIAAEFVNSSKPAMLTPDTEESINTELVIEKQADISRSVLASLKGFFSQSTRRCKNSRQPKRASPQPGTFSQEVDGIAHAAASAAGKLAAGIISRKEYDHIAKVLRNASASLTNENSMPGDVNCSDQPPANTIPCVVPHCAQKEWQINRSGNKCPTRSRGNRLLVSERTHTAATRMIEFYEQATPSCEDIKKGRITTDGEK